MSYLATELARILKQNGLKAAELARKSQLGRPEISRWLNGLQVYISEEDLTAIARASSKNPKDHARLVWARLMDVKKGPGAELVKVTVLDEPMSGEECPAYAVKLPPKVQADMDKIMAAIGDDPQLRRIIHGLANYLE